MAKTRKTKEQRFAQDLLKKRLASLIMSVETRGFSTDLPTSIPATEGHSAIDGMDKFTGAKEEFKKSLVTELTKEERLNDDVERRFSACLTQLSKAINGEMKKCLKQGFINPISYVLYQDFPVAFEVELADVMEIVDVETLFLDEAGRHIIEKCEKVVSAARVIRMRVPLKYMSQDDWLLFGDTIEAQVRAQIDAGKELTIFADTMRKACVNYLTTGEMIAARGNENLVMPRAQMHPFYQSEKWMELCAQVAEVYSGGQCERVVDGIRCPQSHQQTHHMTYFRKFGGEKIVDLLGTCFDCHPALDAERSGGRRKEQAQRDKYAGVRRAYRR